MSISLTIEDFELIIIVSAEGLCSLWMLFCLHFILQWATYSLEIFSNNNYILGILIHSEINNSISPLLEYKNYKSRLITGRLSNLSTLNCTDWIWCGVFTFSFSSLYSCCGNLCHLLYEVFESFICTYFFKIMCFQSCLIWWRIYV